MWEKELWIAKRNITTNDDGNDIESFEKPIKYRMNYQPVSGYLDYMKYGENVENVYRTFVSKNIYQGVIKAGDKVYLSDNDVLEKDLERLVNNDNELCKNANYKVEVVLPQNLLIKIDFLKIKEIKNGN